jgi:glycosyltransferase involved in cell wall biosynthesis
MTEPVAFVWIGSWGIDSEFARQIQNAAGNGVCFVGAVKDPGLYFAASEVVTVTSRFESFSCVALEAGALGRPVLAFASARGPADLLSAESLLLEPSASALAEALVDLLAHPEEAEQRGSALRERIAAGFLAKQWMPRLLNKVAEVERV